MNKRIIIVGPSASGKNYLRKKFMERGYTHDVSYTTRPIRKGEIDGDDYNFLSHKEFMEKADRNGFYEWVEYKGNLYGTGMMEWIGRDIFIMETSGISKITPEDRKRCMIIFINPPLDSRIKRMILERGWTWEEISKRLDFDEKCFKDFSDYDIKITDAYF